MTLLWQWQKFGNQDKSTMLCSSKDYNLGPWHDRITFPLIFLGDNVDADDLCSDVNVMIC